jgi:hypothetical protein
VEGELGAKGSFGSGNRPFALLPLSPRMWRRSGHRHWHMSVLCHRLKPLTCIVERTKSAVDGRLEAQKCCLGVRQDGDVEVTMTRAEGQDEGGTLAVPRVVPA